MNEVAVSQGLDRVDQRMRLSAFEPEVAGEIVVAWCDSDKASTCLKDDARLLRADVNLTEMSDGSGQSVEDFAHQRTLGQEVLVDRVSATRM